MRRKAEIQRHTYQWWQVKLFHADMDAMKVEVNGKTYHGFPENINEHTIKHMSKCRNCGSLHMVGTRICTKPGCVGPITKEMKDAMQLQTAIKCYKRFANGLPIHFWEFRAWLDSTPESELNVIRFNDDEESINKVSRFLDQCLEKLKTRQRHGIERPIFAPVAIAETWAPRLEAGRNIHGIRGAYSEFNQKAKKAYDSAQKKGHANVTARYDSTEKVFQMPNGVWVTYAEQLPSSQDRNWALRCDAYA